MKEKRNPVAKGGHSVLLSPHEAHLIISGTDIVIKKIDHQKILEAHLPSKKHFTTLQELEREYINRVLSHFDHNRTKTAEVLGIDRVSLWRKIKKLGLTP